jgi:hypothetical protein
MVLITDTALEALKKFRGQEAGKQARVGACVGLSPADNPAMSPEKPIDGTATTKDMPAVGPRPLLVARIGRI